MIKLLTLRALALATFISLVGSFAAQADGAPVGFKFMRDVDPNSKISDIHKFSANTFSDETVYEIRSTYGERSLWLKIENWGPTDVLRLGIVLDAVTLFVRKDRLSPWREVWTGDQIDQSRRSRVSPFMALPIPEDTDFSLAYLRIVQPTAITIKLDSWSNKRFAELEESDENLKIFLFGFVIATIAYNIFVSALLRNVVFLFNALTVSFLLLFSLYLSGYGVAYFWGQWTGWSNAISIFAIYCAIVFGSLFLWQFLKSENERLIAGWPIFYAPVLVTFIVLLSPFLPFWVVQLCTLIASALLLLSTLALVFRRGWRGDQKARILIVPLLFAVIPGLVLLTLDRVFGIATLSYSQNTLEITFCLEALLFSLALVARVRIAEQDARTANENVLRLKYENSVKSVRAQDNERRRLAKDLHDGVGQNFLSVVGSLKSLAVKQGESHLSKSLEKIVDVATSSLNELRRISKDMHPSTIEHLGLKRAIEMLFENLEISNQIDTDLKLEFNEAEFTANEELNIYRIFQECLSNVARHADATCCRAALVSAQGFVDAYVEDDGSGLDKTNSNGLGLVSIQERVETLKGTFNISESEKGGVRVEFRFPLTMASGGADIS